VLSDKVTAYFTLLKNCAFLGTFVHKVTNQIVTLFRSECNTSNASIFVKKFNNRKCVSNIKIYLKILTFENKTFFVKDFLTVIFTHNYTKAKNVCYHANFFQTSVTIFGARRVFPQMLVQELIEKF
jgi:hypothetical protein